MINTNVFLKSPAIINLFAISYRDPSSPSGYTAPAPVIWERPAGFSKEIANKLMIAGDLRNTLVLITRNGAAGDMQTTYSMDLVPATHPVFKSEMVPNDFSEFANFNIAKHSYWEKTVDEINTYLTTGSFPESIRTNAAPAQAVAPTYTAPAQPAYTAPAQTATYQAPVQPAAAPVYQAPVAPANQAAPAAQPSGQAPTTPTRSFNGFSF